MTIKLFDTVVLEKNIQDQGLCRGDMGVAVELYEPGGLEVKFVTGSGKTQALVTLKSTEVRLISNTDILAVRSLNAA
jgi:Domain of unknown function (DUF4926)